MPIECFLFKDGEIVERIPVDPEELFYIPDYSSGVLQRIIGIESPVHDLCGIVHVIDDEEILQTVTPENVNEVFSDETWVESIMPNSTHAIDTTDFFGDDVTLVMEHTIPFTQTMN